MEACYQTLATIYEIVKSDPSPHTYLCSPHQIILNQTADWFAIQKHLEVLAAEKLIIVKQLDKIAISITFDGIAKAKSFKNNFVNNNFSFQNDNQFSGPKLNNYCVQAGSLLFVDQIILSRSSRQSLFYYKSFLKKGTSCAASIA